MGNPLERITIDETWFKTRWEEYSRKARLPSDPLATVELEMAELRKFALEVFSWGVVHQAIAQRRLEELLPTG